MFNMEKFSTLLSSKRREKGLSQGQLAELVGVTHQAVSKWERGEAMPEISKIGDIAKIISVPTNELLNALYGNEESENIVVTTNDADAEYFALTDKTRVGDLFALAPRMSKETLHIAIDTLISAKGAGSASMLFQFADKEYLSALGTRLFSMGDLRLAEYVDDAVLKSSIVENISNADSTMDNSSRMAFYKKAGQLLAYCKDVKFVDSMFAHLTDTHHRWDYWKEYVGRFPSEAVVKQGIKMAIHNGPGCFNTWWDIIGRRNMAKIFLGYIDNYDKNNSRAWDDVFYFYGYADSAIMEAAIKERINDPEMDLQIFQRHLRRFSPELQNLFAKKGVVFENFQQNTSSAKTNVKVTQKFPNTDIIEKMVMNKIQDEINDADLEDIPHILSNITSSLQGFRSVMGNGDSSGKSDEMLVAIMEQLEVINNRLVEIEDHLDDLDSRIDDIEGMIDE